MTDDEPTFSPAVERQHRRYQVSASDAVYVVGDVHGCIDELERLLAELAPSEDDLVVFVGDLVGKGPDARAVVDLVRDREYAVSVRGNCEAQQLRAGNDASLAPAALEWLASLPVVISWPGALVTHAGIDPRKPLAEQTVADLQRVRSLGARSGYEPPYWFEAYDGPRRIYFGHTVLNRPLLTPHAIGLDTGCVYGGELTAYDVREERTISVDSRGYVQRDPGSICRL